MAKKKKKPEEPMTPTQPASQPAGSRHKPRKMIAFLPRLYRLITALAKKNRRPVQWEATIALEEHLRRNGMLDDAEESEPEDE